MICAPQMGTKKGRRKKSTTTLKKCRAMFFHFCLCLWVGKNCHQSASACWRVRPERPRVAVAGTSEARHRLFSSLPLSLLSTCDYVGNGKPLARTFFLDLRYYFGSAKAIARATTEEKRDDKKCMCVYTKLSHAQASHAKIDDPNREKKGVKKKNGTSGQDW